MSGETDLERMLKTLKPVLDPRLFAFASFPGMTLAEAAQFTPVCLFVEREGLTVIAEATALADRIAADAPLFRMISLSVHSSLEAVGLTAAFSQALAERGISANVVAGFFHDHLFVPQDDAGRAMETLATLARS